MKLTEGKSRQVFATESKDEVRVFHKDDETAYNGIKHVIIPGKGIIINKISAILYETLERNGIATHYIRTIDDRQQLCRKVEPIRLEFIVRNYAAGDMTERLDVKTGTKLSIPVVECCYKSDELDDPIINRSYAIALGMASREELDLIEEELGHINLVLTSLFHEVGIKLVDFKVEFGRLADGTLLVCDELSPDSCRLWDEQTGDSMDRDRFRYDLGNVGEMYEEVLRRLSNFINE